MLQHSALHLFHMIDGQNTHAQITGESINENDQIAFCAFYSFLVEVQTKLATYVLCMCNNNLESRTMGDKRSPQ